MDSMAQSYRRSLSVMTLSLLIMAGTVGCVATRGWVYEQIVPIEERLSEVDTRTDLVLKNLENLRLEQHLVLGERKGTSFAADSAQLTPQAQRAIDNFLKNVHETNTAVFLVAGHTDSTGPEDHNYLLGQQRAASVAQYLVASKGIHPMRVTTISFGESVPTAENTTQQGRFRNRRVEIQVYKRAILSSVEQQRLGIEPRQKRQGQPSKEVAHGRY